MAKENTKRAGYNSVVVAEYRLLNAIAKNVDFLSDSRVADSIFIDEVAKSLFEAINNLYDSGIPITKGSLLQAGNEVDFNVTEAIVDQVFNIENTEVNTIEDILSSLQNAQLKYNLTNKIEELKEKVNRPGVLSVDDVLPSIYELDDTVLNSTKSSSKLMSYEEWSNNYIDELEQRRSGHRYSYGDPLLDENLFKGAYPGAITTIAGSPGMGKSTFALSLANGLLESNTPVMYISLEMSSTDQYDRLLSSRKLIDSEELYLPENVDGLIEAVKDELSILSDRKNFYFCEEPNLSVAGVKALIREFKKKTHSDYVVVIIDLLTQLKEFMSANNNNTTANSIEIGMNSLNALAKSENCHIIGVVQFRRASDQMKVNNFDDIQKLRPSLNDIKNSGAIAERSRVVLSVFRSNYYAEKYFDKNNRDLMAQLETSTDIMDVQILKNSSGQSGQMLNYIYDAPHFKVLPVFSREELEELQPTRRDPKRDALDRLVNMGIENEF